jgi:hypothetical protein
VIQALDEDDPLRDCDQAAPHNPKLDAFAEFTGEDPAGPPRGT